MSAKGDAGFTKVPNRVLRDASLSPAARGIYVVLLDLAWQATDSVRDVYEDLRFSLTEEEIALAAGCSVKAFCGYVKQLLAAGLVTRERPSRRARLVWTIRRSPSPAESAGLSPAEGEGLSPADSAQPRARSSSRSKKKTLKNDDYVVDDDALVEVTDENGNPVDAVIEQDTFDKLIEGLGATPKQRAEFEAAYRENPDGFAGLVANARNHGHKPVAVITTAVRSAAHLADWSNRGLSPEEIRQMDTL